MSAVVRLSVGLAWTAWRYMWRITPVHRWELSGSRAMDFPPALPGGIELRDVQRVGDGAGALFHRVYRTSIRGAELNAEQLMARIAADLNALAPSGMAEFDKVLGDPDTMGLNDEYVVRMPGPWDGPVRVIAVDRESFRLATLDGHLEAGQIEFRAHSSARSVEFVIESWARSGDRFSDLLYAHLRMAKEIQLHMWTSVLERVVELAGGQMTGGIRVITRGVDSTEAADSPTPKSRRRLAALGERAVNFDPSRSEEYTTSAGWHVDDLSAVLPKEPSGEPVEAGCFLVARQLLDDYQVADPGRLRAVFDRDSPLAGRDMLLAVRFLLLRIYVGVRIGEPYDETRVIDGQRARVFGWNYRTVEGHFEEGEMHYQLWKSIDSGDVEFRIHAYSRVARSGPWWLRLGFRLVGRRQQLAYYRSACRRMRRLTESQLDLADVRRRDETRDSAQAD